MTKELTGWKKKYKILNTNTGVLEGHKTYVDIYHKPGMRKDFRDVRFTNKNGNLLPHYLLGYSESSYAQFWVWLPPPTANPYIYCHFGNGAVNSASSFSSIQGLFIDYFETGTADTTLWDLKGYPAGSAGIKTDIKYNSYSLGLDVTGIVITQNYYDVAHALLKIPLTSFPVGSRMFIFMLAYRGTTSSPADFMGFGTGATSSTGPLYNLPADSTWHDYLIKIYRSATNTYDIYVMKDGVLDGSYVGVSRTYTTNLLFGLQSYELSANVSDKARIDNVLAYLEPAGGWFTGYPAALTWGQRCLVPYRKSPYSRTVTAETSLTLTAELAGYQESINYSVAGLQIKKPEFRFGNADPVTDSSTGITWSAPAATIIDYEGMEDFALISSTIKKGIGDSYWTYSGSGAGSLFPVADSNIKFNAEDPDGGTHTLFSGKMLPSRPSFSFIGDSTAIEGADFAQNLAIQKIPWDARILKLDEITYLGWDVWVSYLCDFSKNNLVSMIINRPLTGSVEISLDPKATRLEAIKKICDFTGYLFITKLVNIGTALAPIWKTGAYFLDPADIDLQTGGLDLPSPVTLTAPDSSLLDAPSLEPDLENNYNTVTVYGTNSGSQIFYTVTACTSRVKAGLEAVREYRLEDSTSYERGVPFQYTAVRWLVYFMTRQATVKMKFINRFDFELFQRIKFGAGFNQDLRNLTDQAAFTTVHVFDARDSTNGYDIDISGIPRPSWLRVTNISYSCQNLQNIVEVTAKTDWIYSNSDPVINPVYSQYIGSGYYKPEIEDSVSTTQSLIDNSISKQAKAQKGTILSISTDGKTAEVQTADGKTITAAVVSEATVGANVLVIPGSSGYYIS